MPVILDYFDVIEKPSTYNRIVYLIGVNLFVFPVFLTRDISGLRYFNLIGFIAVFYTLCVIAIEAPAYHKYEFEQRKGDTYYALRLNLMII